MRNKVKHWVMADLHLGHSMLCTHDYRPGDFENQILFNTHELVEENDIFYLLGDFALYNINEWHDIFFRNCRAKTRILILGNHDRETISKYYSYGWSAVCSEMVLNMFGKRIILTHHPIEFDLLKSEDTINIHGHVHNTNHHEDNLVKGYHFPVIMEHEYKPILLRKLIGL